MLNNTINYILTDDESIVNLNDLIHYRNNIVPFIGAGMSVSMGYQTWFNFLKSKLNTLSKNPDLKQKVKSIRNKLSKKDYLDVADEIDKLYNNNFYTVIKRDFAPRENMEKADHIQFLQQLGCKTVLTTNYDNVLETQMVIDNKYPELVLPYSSYDIIDKDKTGNPLVVKLHGTYDEPDSIVFTKTQYEEKYTKNTHIKKTMEYFWISKTLLFMGCSLEKDYLVEFISQLAGKKGTMSHFAILEEPKSKKAKENKQIAMDRLNIRPIWYQYGEHINTLNILHFIAGGNRVTNISGNIEQVFQPKTTVENICHPFLDSIALACKPDQRNELFCSILKISNKPMYISSIIKNIFGNSIHSLCIFGEPGTGKSTLLSLLYMEFIEKSVIYSQYIPVYIDLHYYEYERKSINEAKNDLETRINKIKKIISGQPTRALLFIDGLDEYQRNNKVLTECLYAFINDSSVVAKTIFAIGNISKNLGLLAGIRAIKNKNFDETITLNLFHRKGREIIRIIKILLKLYGLSLDTRNYSKTINKIKDLAINASGNLTDFRTLNFLVSQYKKRVEILDQSIGEIYINHYSGTVPDLNNLAEQVTKFMIDKKDNHKITKMTHVFKSQSIRNFFYAYHYVETMINKNHENLRYFDSIFNPCVNRFVISIINSNTKKCSDFVSNVMDLYDNLTDKQQIQILYLFGRVKHEKDKAIRILLEAYNKCLSMKDDKSINDHNYLMRYRTAGIALIYSEYTKTEDDFYIELIYNDKLKKLNRLFHLDYYINDAYTIGEERALNADTLCTGQNIKRLYDALYYTIIGEPTEGKYSYLLSILTIIDLVMYDRYNSKTPIGLYDKPKFKKLIDTITTEKSIANQTVKSYITFINSTWTKNIPGLDNKSPIEDKNIYNSLIQLFYRLKMTIRKGWTEDGRRVEKIQHPESVADHTWACCLIAMILLSEDINKCPFIKNIAIEEYKEYNKSRILELLMVHDLPESYMGDNIGNKKDPNLEIEFMDRLQFYDYFPYFGSFHHIGNLIKEYSACIDINACIAYDIDKLEPLIQLYIYKDFLENPYKKISSEWEESVDKKLKTTLGRKIFEFITKNITH